MEKESQNQYSEVNSSYMKEGPCVEREVENNDIFEGGPEGIEDNPLPNPLPPRKIKIGVN